MPKDSPLTLTGFSFNDGSDPVEADPYRCMLLNPAYYRLSQLEGTTIPKTTVVGKLSPGTRLERFKTNIRVILEAVFFFSELWGYEDFWSWLSKCLKLRDLNWKAEALEKVVSSYCEGRKSYRSKSWDKLALSPPTPLATLVDMIIKIQNSRPTPPSRSQAHVKSTLLSLKQDWPKRLRRVLDSIKSQAMECKSEIKQEVSPMPHSSDLRGVAPNIPSPTAHDRAAPPRSDPSWTPGERSVGSSESEAESVYFDHARPNRCSVPRDKGRTSPEHSGGDDGDSLNDGDDDLTDESNAYSPPSIPVVNGVSLPIANSAQKPLSYQLPTQAQRKVHEQCRELALTATRKSSSTLQPVVAAQEDMDLITTSGEDASEDDTPALTIYDRSAGAKKRKASADGMDDIRAPKRRIVHLTQQFARRYKTEPSGNQSKGRESSEGSDGSGSLSTSSVGIDSDGEHSSADKDASHSISDRSKAATQPALISNALKAQADDKVSRRRACLELQSSAKADEVADTRAVVPTSCDDLVRPEGRDVGTEKVELKSAIEKVAQLEALITCLHNELLSSFRAQSDTTRASLTSVEERVLQLERNQFRADQLELEMTQLQSKMQEHIRNVAAPTLPSSSNLSYPLLPSGSEHLEYLRSRDVKPFLDGASDEIRKIRSVLRAKLKEQDCSNEGWTKQVYLAEVIWQLDGAIEKAKKGVTAL